MRRSFHSVQHSGRIQCKPDNGCRGEIQKKVVKDLNEFYKMAVGNKEPWKTKDVKDQPEGEDASSPARSKFYSLTNKESENSCSFVTQREELRSQSFCSSEMAIDPGPLRKTWFLPEIANLLKQTGWLVWGRGTRRGGSGLAYPHV